MKYFEAAHQRFAWLTRINPKIQDIFKFLWDTDELVVSFDGCCYYPKNYSGEPKYWIHSDQSPLKKGLHCIQSYVSLTSNKERTFIVYEGSHKLHEQHTNMYNIDNPSDWYPINQDFVDTIQDKKKILHVEAGSLILWDSRTFHQNTCGDPSCNEERLVQYLCYLPKNHEENDAETQQLRLQYFNDLYTTNHWPYPIAAVSKQPTVHNYYNNERIDIDYESLQLPSLDDLYYQIFQII